MYCYHRARPGDSLMCSGHGDCVCGACQCTHVSLHHCSVSCDHYRVSCDHYNISCDHYGISYDHCNVSCDHYNVIIIFLRLRVCQVLNLMVSIVSVIQPSVRPALLALYAVVSPVTVVSQCNY